MARLLAAALSLLVLAGPAWAQDYPNRPVRVIIPFPPGGAPDLTGRVLATRLAERLGQPFVAENRTGAGGNIAAEFVAKAPPDGYTLFAASDGPLVINPHVYAKIPFDTLRDFAPISIATSAGFALMACPTVPVQSVADVVKLAKTKRLSIASSGFGTNHHLLAEMLKSAAGIDLLHVPYKGFGQAVGDAVGCSVDLIFGAISSGIPHIRAGKLRPLAVSVPQRHPGLPDTPTFTEVGYPQVAMDAYFGMLAPAGTPRPIIQRLHAEIVALLKEPETADKLRAAGLDIVASSPEEFSARLKTDLERFARIARTLGAKVE
ncbi:MAG TPA: tripartite tricarboxylate transporter substrate binding protein [Burkholderiales bacterium]|nr:tripartite tricarboxylate transporter substrate binding protein [Burkholderiales bacterium]